MRFFTPCLGTLRQMRCRRKNASNRLSMRNGSNIRLRVREGIIMHFRIKDIEREHIVELDDTLTMPQIASESSQIKEVDDVHAHIQLAVEPALFHATGTVDTNVVYECSRCLTEFKQPLHAVLEESFTQNPAKANEDIHL